MNEPAKPLRCTTCDSDLFFEARKAGGWWKTLISGDGATVMDNTESVTQGPRPLTVRCSRCFKRYPNPNYGAA